MADQQAILKTNKGDITINLFPDHAPRTVQSFVGLATGNPVEVSADGPFRPSPREGSAGNTPFYDGLGFHRIIPGFMIQGGCPQGTGTGGPGYTFDDETQSGLTFDKPYLLAMANAGVQGGRGTNGSQFFITVGATTWLNGKHTIFGEVADQEGRDVVDAIANVETGAGDRPVEPVVIESVQITGA
jgi:peptidyl-prolyl cis-trans isomerase A (cyclophilin A)